MNKILTVFLGQRQRGWTIVMLLAVIATSLVLGGIPYKNAIYYVVIGIGAFLVLLKGRCVNGRYLALIFVCGLSIVVNRPPAFFRTPERLALFILMLLVVSPLIYSPKLNVFRQILLRYCLVLCALTGAGSLVCYFLGINMMVRGGEMLDVDSVGGFGGLCNHSMTLGPIASLGSVFMLYLNLFAGRTCGKKVRMLIWVLFAMSLCAVMISASRSSLAGALIAIIAMVYMRYHRNSTRLVKAVFVALILGIVSFPAYEPFLMKTIQKQIINNKMGSATASRATRWAHRKAEFLESPIVGIGFNSIDKKYTEEYLPKQGTIEPGSSWLSILSMTGILGVLSFGCILFPPIVGLYKLIIKKTDSIAILLFSVLLFYFTHMFAESYIISGGTYQGFLFWLTLGVAEIYTRKVKVPAPILLSE